MIAPTAVFLVLSLASCAPGLYLRTEAARDSDLTGTYSLILYGGRYSDDVENVAIFDREGDSYVFEIYAPDFDYRTLRNVPAREAFEEAEKFVGFHHSFRYSRLSRILDPAGNTIGYELRPLYTPTDFGYADILDVYYSLRDGKVSVSISLKPGVRSIIREEERPFLFRFRR